MFGLQQYSRRYSTPNNLKGAKLSVSDMNRTHSLKLRKVNGILTARTHLPDYERRESFHAEDEKLDTNALFFSHSKVLKRIASPIPRPPSRNNGLMIESSKPQRREPEAQVQSEADKKEKVYFYSSNLDQNMNLYMNRMLNKSEHERKEKIRQFEEKINITYLDKINTGKTQNQFWRKMRRSISKKERPLSREDSARTSSNKAMWEQLMNR